MLADKAINGAFKKLPVFIGLCKVIVEAVERKMKNKGKQNLKYPEEFTSFLVILGGICTKTLDLFRQNLEGQLQEYKTGPGKIRQEKWALRQRLQRRRHRHVQVPNAALA